MQNPLLETWTTPFGIAPFDAIKPDHFQEAIATALQIHLDEIAALTANPAEPDFENTILALERSGRDLTRIATVFYNLASADTNDDLQALQREIAPKLAEHSSRIMLDHTLFARIRTVNESENAKTLNAEQARLLEKTYDGFVRAGALLEGKAKNRMDAINQRLALLGTQFAQNVLADESTFELVLENAEDRAGLPDFLQDAAAQAAHERGHEGKHVITLARASIDPFLQFSDRRDLREIAYKASINRGANGGETDNHAIAEETLALRAEKANLLGYESFAAYKLEKQMAKTPDAVRDLLQSVWQPARTRANEERTLLAEQAQAEGQNIAIEAWDWRYYAEKVRKARYAINEADIKPYLQLDRIIAAAFATAERLFGLTFKERFDIPTYHPDVRTFEVFDENGETKALFLGDYFARPSKRSGAWMTNFRQQETMDGVVIPIIVNVMNFAKGAEGSTSLLTFDDARTLFHEFGHALHGMLSDVTYPSLAGTSVARDFVELPSQLYEHWLEQPEILGEFATHYQTGEPMPDTLIAKLKAADTFNQGFATVEYTACALIDLDLHMQTDSEAIDLKQFETAILAELDMPAAIAMRHRPTHFQHVFAGDGYAAGYYSYMWSEVMDADAFDAFREAGNIFDPDLSARLKNEIYAAGGKPDPEEAYTAFRGRLPSIAPLLRNRGLQS